MGASPPRVGMREETISSGAAAPRPGIPYILHHSTGSRGNHMTTSEVRSAGQLQRHERLTSLQQCQVPIVCFLGQSLERSFSVECEQGWNGPASFLSRLYGRYLMTPCTVTGTTIGYCSMQRSRRTFTQESGNLIEGKSWPYRAGAKPFSIADANACQFLMFRVKLSSFGVIMHASLGRCGGR